MKVLTIDKANSLIEQERDGALHDNLVKVKVTSAVIAHSDIALLSGKDLSRLPIVPSRIAVGLVSESADDFGLRKGERVLLNPYRNGRICAMDIDGYLGDYAVLPLDCVHTLPEGVSDASAVFAEHIALAIRCLDKIKVEKGDYVAVLGTSHFSLLLAQLIDYYHAIPIVIGSDPAGLEMAADIGITYRIDLNTTDAVQRVNLITGGKLCDCTVLEGAACTAPQLAFSLAKTLGRVCVAGIDSYIGRLSADLCTVLDKRLMVIGVTNGGKNIPSAINLLATGALHTALLPVDHTDYASVGDYMRSLTGRGYNGITVCHID